MTRAWILPMSLVLSGVLVATAQVRDGSPVLAVVLLLVFAVLAWLYSPLAFPRSIGAVEAQRRSAADGRPVVYWRAGRTSTPIPRGCEDSCRRPPEGRSDVPCAAGDDGRRDGPRWGTEDRPDVAQRLVRTSR
ncbi:hypothetical protein [[Kitasatospora] papulosa]|uniref:hypothetical protein n=1 Tax=[Kitasatospora] papulosa TaxID=1464011 RepID=UPI003714EACB